MQKECSVCFSFSGLPACCGPFFLFYPTQRWSRCLSCMGRSCYQAWRVIELPLSRKRTRSHRSKPKGTGHY